MFHCLDKFMVEIPQKNLKNIYIILREKNKLPNEDVSEELIYLGVVDSEHYVYSKMKESISLFKTYQENSSIIKKLNSESNKDFELQDKIKYNLIKFITFKNIIMLNSKVEMNYNYQDDKHIRHLEEQKLLSESFKYYKNELVKLLPKGED